MTMSDCDTVSDPPQIAPSPNSQTSPVSSLVHPPSHSGFTHHPPTNTAISTSKNLLSGLPATSNPCCFYFQVPNFVSFRLSPSNYLLSVTAFVLFMHRPCLSHRWLSCLDHHGFVFICRAGSSPPPLPTTHTNQSAPHSSPWKPHGAQ